MSAVRILLVDDHAIVREGIKRLLERQPDLSVVGESEDGADALLKIAALQPDVVMMDLSMPGMSGLEAMRLAQPICPGARIIALTVHEDDGYVREAMRIGARGYLLKRTLPDAIPRAIQTVARGGVFIDPTIAASIRLDPAAGPQAATPDDLSGRERSVLRGIAQGYSNKEIADQLKLSVKTVETYKARAMVKLGLRSRVDIVRLANRHGWINNA